jgi:hypothetical protein
MAFAIIGLPGALDADLDGHDVLRLKRRTGLSFRKEGLYHRELGRGRKHLVQASGTVTLEIDGHESEAEFFERCQQLWNHVWQQSAGDFLGREL